MVASTKNPSSVAVIDSSETSSSKAGLTARGFSVLMRTISVNILLVMQSSFQKSLYFLLIEPIAFINLCAYMMGQIPRVGIIFTGGLYFSSGMEQSIRNKLCPWISLPLRILYLPFPLRLHGVIPIILLGIIDFVRSSAIIGSSGATIVWNAKSPPMVQKTKPLSACLHPKNCSATHALPGSGRWVRSLPLPRLQL